MLTLTACGGESVTPGAGGAPAGMSGTSSGGNAGAPELTETIDDVNRSGDAGSSIPGEPAAFFWLGGLGNWFVCNGAEGGAGTRDAEVADVVPPRGDSRQAFRVQGSGQALGVDLYAQLRHPDGGAVDLSAYAGVGFWAKLEGESDQLTVGLSAHTPFCYAASDVTTAAVSVSATWQQFELPFESFDSDGHGIANIEFIVGIGGGAFDLWIDDLSLLCRGDCPTRP